MMRTKSGICLIIAVIVASTIAFVALSAPPRAQNGFELQYRKTRSTASGAPVVESEYKILIKDRRYKRAGGTGGEVIGSFDGLDQMLVNFSSVQWHQRHEEFMGEDVVLGYKTYIHGTTGQDGVLIKKWYATEIPLVPLRISITSRDEVLTDEAVNIVSRVVTDQELSKP